MVARGNGGQAASAATTTGTPTDGVPFTFVNAFVAIGATPVDVSCLVKHCTLKPDVKKETATTLCGAVDYVGAVKWLFGGTLYQSFSAQGTFATLQAAWAAQPAPVAIVVRPQKAAASPTNPEFHASGIPEPTPIFDTDAGVLAEVVYEFGLIGPPTVVTSLAGRAVPLDEYLSDRAEQAIAELEANGGSAA